MAELSQQDILTLKRLATKVYNIRGPGVAHTPDGITIGQPAVQQQARQQLQIGLVPVWLTRDGTTPDGFPTYTLYDYPAKTRVYAYRVPLFNRRSIAYEAIGVVAERGIAYFNGGSTSTLDLGGTGYNGLPPGYNGSGGFTGSSGATVYQPWELWHAYEQYYTVDGCGTPSGTGANGATDGSSGTETGTGGT